MRLIDADALVEDIGKEIDTYKKVFLSSAHCSGMKTVIRIVKNQDTIDPVKHGRWIHVDELPSGDYFKCSECNHHIFLKFGWKVSFESPAYEYRYCSLCGARMDQDTGGDNNGSGEAKKE